MMEPEPTPLPGTPEDYYWIKWANGVRYYLRSTNKVIAKSKIHPEIIPLIQEKDKTLQAQATFEKLHENELKISFLEQTLQEYQAKGFPSSDSRVQAVQKRLTLAQQKQIKLRDDYQKIPENIRDELNQGCSYYVNRSYRRPSDKPNPFNDYANKFRAEYQNYVNNRRSDSSNPRNTPNPKSKPQPRVNPKPSGSNDEAYPPQFNPTQADRDLLMVHGILNEKDWKKWLLRNHPDKNSQADLDLVQAINSAAKRVFY